MEESGEMFASVGDEIFPGPEVIKLFFEHEILNAHKCKKIKKVGFFRLR